MSSRSIGAYESIPELMRIARGSYAWAVNARLAAEGIDDLPRNGAFALSYLARGEESVVDMIEGLGVTKQVVSQLLDTRVVRGYLTRDSNPEDRRRMTIELTERGHAAVAAIGAGTNAIDGELAHMLSDDELHGMRAGLVALGQIKERMKAGS
jgi:DNA-binding MarR family transcriptional regulator